MKKLVRSSIYSGLPRTIWMLSVCNLINGLGYFIFPFLEMYLTARLGLTPSHAGTYIMMLCFCYVPGSFLGGKIADKFERKKTVVFSQLGITIVLFACGFLEGKKIILLLLLLMEIFDGFCDPPRQAIAQDVTSKSNRQAAFSLMYLSKSLGYIIGPMVAGFLFSRAPRWIFLGTGIASTLSLFVMTFFVPESKPDREAVQRSLEEAGAEKAESGTVWKALWARKPLLLFALGGMFLSTGYRQIALVGLPEVLLKTFGEPDGPTVFGIVNAVNGLVSVLATAPVVTLIHRRHPLKNMMLACLFYIGAFSFIGLFGARPWLYYITTVVFTVGELIQSTNSNFYIANNTPISHRARFNAVLFVLINSGTAWGPIIGGVTIDKLGLNWIWPSSALFSALGMVLFGIVYGLDSRRAN